MDEVLLPQVEGGFFLLVVGVYVMVKRLEYI